MKYIVISKKHFLPILAIICVIFFVFRDLSLAFFQQDEWHAFGYHILLGDLDMKDFLKTVFLTSVFHYTPLTVLSIKLLFYLFEFNYMGYALVSIGLHAVVAVMVFYFARILFKNGYLALISSLLFSVSAAGYQATAWVMADIGTHGATAFGLLSVIFILKLISSAKKSWLYLSIVSLVVSLLFKEITIGLFVVIPLIFYLFADKSLKSKARLPWIFFAVFIFYFAFRAMLFAGSPANLTSVDKSNRNNLFHNAILFSIKTVAQTVIPPGQILQFSYWFTSRLPEDIRGEKGTTAFDIFAQENILRITEFLLFLFIALGAFSLWKKSKDVNSRKILLTSFLFIIINSGVYIFSPERTETVSIIDSRNLYFTSIGTSIFTIAILMEVTKCNLRKIFLFLLPILFINIFWLNKELKSLVEVGNLRKKILTQIKKDYPNLPERVIFYTQSDTSYYGLPPEEKIMPFQSGFGQTLLIWYYPTEKFPKDFFQDKFLWNITEQGYKFYDNRGFGYFREEQLLKKAIKDNGLSQNSIISFSWDSKYSALVDTTNEIKKDNYGD